MPRWQSGSSQVGIQNLEYDLSTGERGSRNAAIGEALRAATGAEDALVVNTAPPPCFSYSIRLPRAAKSSWRANQLAEIGGGFRLPEVLERSGG